MFNRKSRLKLINFKIKNKQFKSVLMILLTNKMFNNKFKKIILSIWIRTTIFIGKSNSKKEIIISIAMIIGFIKKFDKVHNYLRN